MVLPQHFRSFATAVGWLPNSELDGASDLSQGDTKESEGQTPGSECSAATTYYDVFSGGPNLYDLPVEILGIIISPLSRQDVKNLRLVSRQCEAKVSAHYFREVIIPFHSQFFDPTAPDGAGALKNMSNTMLSNGGRVFTEFGHLIHRFALSLELDEDALESPPLKPKQEVIRTFWGLYRWPHARYSRYQDVSGMENDADEFWQMKKALRCLSYVTTLGLCSDVGLGFLSGPMVKARHDAIRHRVFLDPDCEQHKSKWEIKPLPAVTVGEAQEASNRLPRAPGPTANDWKAQMLEAMLRSSGFKEDQMQAALALLLESENATSISDMGFDESHVPERPKETTQDDQWNLLPPYRSIQRLPAGAIQKRTPKDYALVPKALTLPQKEMLLELEWAHRAMTQSYILSAVDCSGEGCFRHLTTFNIAKIPSSHLHILSRSDFWKSFPSLRNVSLGVVADWRRVYVPSAGCIDEMPVSPLDAVPLAHALLKDYISVEAKIVSLHFEWICGGELASGCHQRNQHILPAPFFASPQDMARPFMDRVGADSDLLRLPYVKRLSLKNCWVAPHVLLQSLRDFARCSLESFEFEGVSLSAMPSTPEHPPPTSLYQLGAGPAGSSMALLASSHNKLPLEQPSWLSWAGLIEHFSPSRKVRDMLATRHSIANERNADERRSALDKLTRIIPDAHELPDDEALHTLDSITFKSCGYVNLDHETFRIYPMLPKPELALLLGTFPMHSEFTPVMQHCKDTLLGRTINFGVLNDRTPLREVFWMTTGWQGVYDDKILQAAYADGCLDFGDGRFSGTLAKDYVGVKPTLRPKRPLARHPLS